MTTNKLNRYYPYLTENITLEVSDEIAVVLSIGAVSVTATSAARGSNKRPFFRLTGKEAYTLFRGQRNTQYSRHKTRVMSDERHIARTARLRR